ncbi:pollen-specific leucine-rich repeat extensin-like protein 1 [Centruroides sculpturatus]|uniref:pollen-specific leucine-rich repeat extensin-like protein 1 n=1 Tax=Centruroides sculpturatus TaxID=218467 RepID=UPI000C6D1032|nr:pollen-specific leucine-rich repeat extensin-like protein 1 [Centruroides sculpturatus]
MLFNILLIFVVTVNSNHVASATGGISNQHHQQDDAGNYNFGYDVQDPGSHHFRRESGDAYGRVVGSYGLSEADGRHRIVDYVADEYGFRAKVRTNEPGTRSENSAAVEVLKPGHPPGPPRIPNPVVSPAPAPPPPPPADPPSQNILPPPSSVKSYVPYVNAPYNYPYYYSPLPANSLYPLPQNKYPEYIQHPQNPQTIPNPQTIAKFVDPYSYKYVQPLHPTSTHQSQKYSSALVNNPPLLPTQANYNHPADATNYNIGLISSKLPSNYRVVPIPNGIQAVPIDSSSASNLGGGVYQPYNYNVDRNYPRATYPSRDLSYVDTKKQKSYYAYPPTDYRYAGSRQSKSITRVSKSVEQ